MMAVRTAFERRLTAALDASPSRIPVLLGGCGSGRTNLLYALRDRLGRSACQYIDVERTASTPERFLHAIVSASPFARATERPPDSPREAFEQTVAFFAQARAVGGGPATFLIDEALEFRTFESFPGLRHVLHDLVESLAASPNHFVLTTRYVARAHRALRDAASRFEVIHITPLTTSEVKDLMPPSLKTGGAGDQPDADSVARVIHALGDGRPRYIRAIADAMAAMADPHGGADPITALTALTSADGRLAEQCGFCYELRLHRARGYGALKAILEILADEEPLTLTEISHRMHRTPGSTKDYLSWLEDVDLLTVRQKRYSFADPLVRLWVRLHCRPVPPTQDEVAREVQQYAMTRLPQPEPAMALVAHGGRTEPGEDERAKGSWGIIEID